jgi:penicillin-binding protein 1A
VWANVGSRAALAPPSPEAKRHLACKSIDLESGEMQVSGGRAITECFRIDRNGHILDTQYQLVARGDAYGERGYYSVAPNPYGAQEQRGGYYYYDSNGRYVPAQRDPWRPQGQYYYGQYSPYGRDPRYQAQPPRDPYGREYQTPQRIDPGYIWGNRPSY